MCWKRSSIFTWKTDKASWRNDYSQAKSQFIWRWNSATEEGNDEIEDLELGGSHKTQLYWADYQGQGYWQ